MKQAVLLVSFGTTFDDTREKNIDVLAEKIRGTYSEYALYQAVTSNTVLKKLKERGILVNSLTEAFGHMKSDDIDIVAVQPTHVITGMEYEKLVDAVHKAGQDFTEIRLGKVLLAGDEDYAFVAKVVANANNDTGADTAVLWMGHGSPHQSGSAYEKMQRTFFDNGFTNHFMGTVEGLPSFEDAVKRLHEAETAQGRKYKRIRLLPFMLVAGDHANHDMAGENGSWKSVLEEKGYEVDPVFKGLGEYEGILELYLRHLGEIIV